MPTNTAKLMKTIYEWDSTDDKDILVLFVYGNIKLVDTQDPKSPFLGPKMDKNGIFQ